MRLATLGVAVLLVVGMTPALAHTTDDGWHTVENGEGPQGMHLVTADSDYGQEIEIEQDHYAKAGWWNDHQVGLEDGEHTTEEEIIWLFLKHDDGPADVPYNVDVTVDGDVVAAMDIFRLRPAGHSMTPDCPQFLVSDLYPQAGEGLGWAFRLSQETTEWHQRSDTGLASEGDGKMSASINPHHSEHGFVVAVYPQAATTLIDDNADDDNATINATVSINDEKVFVFDDPHDQPPSEPFRTAEWGLSPSVSEINHCVDQGVNLPPALDSLTDGELPDTEAFEQDVQALLDTSIDPADR